MPSRLGLGGGVGLAEAAGCVALGKRDRATELVRPRGADVIWWCEGLSEVLDGDPTSRLSSEFGTGSVLIFRMLESFSVARTVELEEAELGSSLTAGRPCGSGPGETTSLERLPALLRVTGGRLREPDGAIRIGATSPGECDEKDVGVVSRL